MTSLWTCLLFFSLLGVLRSEYVQEHEPLSQDIPLASPQEHKCRRLDDDVLKHLGTKTPYRMVANFDNRPLTFEGCQPIKIAGVIRHGTRTPGKKAASQVRRTLGSVQKLSFSSEAVGDPSELCQYEKNRLLGWKLEMESEEGKDLTREGEDEMLKLAQRYQKRFSSLLPATFSNSTYLLKYTKSQRTEHSAAHFSIGLFGKAGSSHVWYPEAVEKDPVLRFYKLCKQWREDVKESNASKVEMNKFKQTKEALDMVNRVTKLLRINNSTLAYDDVHHMYTSCAFEVAWHKERKSPWCSLFTKQDIKVLEYGEELKYYWRDGYGFPLNHQQACVLTRNIFDFFKSPEEKRAMFYFTHSGTVLKLLSHLGLYKDSSHLTHDLSSDQRADRKWKISYIDTFGSNVVFVLHSCSDGLKVLILHQERVVEVPGCGKELCPLETLVRLVDAGDTCNFDVLCGLNTTHHEL